MLRRIKPISNLLASRASVCGGLAGPAGSFQLNNRAYHSLTSSQIREEFLKYFERNDHIRVPSSSIVPQNDPTLLFTNSGMVQFKEVFLGRPGAGAKFFDNTILNNPNKMRATSAQKCIRAGGKHNDLENVGYTQRHHTFFEMLGNFSFGAYFKEEAIEYAWNFLTKELGLPKERLSVTVYEEDIEAENIWRKHIGLPESKIMRKGKEDNFWSMGDPIEDDGTGSPCGPCTEIFWDQQREVDGERFLEVWNVVFMQYMRAKDGTLSPLKTPCVDTGMGLERIASVLQGKSSNYETDVMYSIIQGILQLIQQRSGKKIIYNTDVSTIHEETVCLKVIADHLRSSSFLIADGVFPSNMGRGYVLRRILRRAIRYGNKLGLKEPFIADLFPVLLEKMGAMYPELNQHKDLIPAVIRQEEEMFLGTLESGLGLIEQEIKNISSKDSNTRTFSGEAAFKLYDTWGFPVDLTTLIARERGFEVDQKRFNELMEQQKARARSAWKGSGDSGPGSEGNLSPDTKYAWMAKGIRPSFIGYETEESFDSTVVAVDHLENEHGSAWISIDPCPFYGEGGGQVGDVGEITLLNPDGSRGTSFSVLDTRRPYEGGLALLVAPKVGADQVQQVDAATLKKALQIGSKVHAVVDRNYRAGVKAHHTATHLLHAALKEVLGKNQVNQAGSLVAHDRLRFDFTSPQGALTPAKLQEIENWVNNAIEKDVPLESKVMKKEQAIAEGAQALFGEKYGEHVRVVQVPGFSKELCGGTHVSRTGDLYPFKILSESAISAGTRRIEAIAGRSATEWYKSQYASLCRIGDALNINVGNSSKNLSARVEERVAKMQSQQADLEKKLDEAKKLLAERAFASSSSSSSSSSAQQQGFHQVKVVSSSSSNNNNNNSNNNNSSEILVRIYNIDEALINDPKMLRDKANELRAKHPAEAHLLINGKSLVLAMGEDALKQNPAANNAGALLREFVGAVGGKGGGDKVLAQGQLSAKAESIEAIVEAWVKNSEGRTSSVSHVNKTD